MFSLLLLFLLPLAFLPGQHMGLTGKTITRCLFLKPYFTASAQEKCD